MKKLAMISACVFLGLAVGCATTKLTTNRAGWSDYAEVVVKDYESMGVVRVTAEETVTRGFLGLKFTRAGSRVTYDAMMAEARKLGADDVINVRIDVTENGTRGILDGLFGSKRVYIYYANALAIRYKAAVPKVGATTDHPDADVKVSPQGWIF